MRCNEKQKQSSASNGAFYVDVFSCNCSDFYLHVNTVFLYVSEACCFWYKMQNVLHIVLIELHFDNVSSLHPVLLAGDSDYISSPVDGGTTNLSSNGGLHHGIQSTSILAAAQSLAMALQQQASSMHPSPDPITADIINTWLDTYLPVSAAFPT